MQLETYVQQVHDQLVASAALGDDRVREIAATLAGTASPAVRLAVLSALAAAADEITAALLDTPGSPVVSVHLDTDEVRVAVATSLSDAEQPPRVDEGDASARISLRLSEALKVEVDEAATRAGVSVNTWLLRAATAALRDATRPGGGQARGGGPGRGGGWDHRAGSAHHLGGWING